MEPMKQNSQMVLQVGEMLKELTLSRQAERNSRANQYQPIAGAVSQQPIQNRSSQPSNQYQPAAGNTSQQSFQNRSSRPREVICFSCGAQGHRVQECRAMNPLPREEQDRLRAMYMRNQQYTANLPFNQNNTGSPPSNQNNTGNSPFRDNRPLSSQQARPQPVSVVEIADEELGVIQDTDPAGTMMMVAQMVEILGEDTAVKKARMGAYINSLSAEDRTFLVAMAEKRERTNQDEGDVLAVGTYIYHTRVIQLTTYLATHISWPIRWIIILQSAHLLISYKLTQCQLSLGTSVVAAYFCFRCYRLFVFLLPLIGRLTSLPRYVSH